MDTNMFHRWVSGDAPILRAYHIAEAYQKRRPRYWSDSPASLGATAALVGGTVFGSVKMATQYIPQALCGLNCLGITRFTAVTVGEALTNTTPSFAGVVAIIAATATLFYLLDQDTKAMELKRHNNWVLFTQCRCFDGMHALIGKNKVAEIQQSGDFPTKVWTSIANFRLYKDHEAKEINGTEFKILQKLVNQILISGYAKGEPVYESCLEQIKDQKAIEYFLINELNIDTLEQIFAFACERKLSTLELACRKFQIKHRFGIQAKKRCQEASTSIYSEINEF